MTISTLFLTTMVRCALSQNDEASNLETGFRNPPDSAKPRVWWHWMNGNITKEGIKLDLEWMKRVGIGGFQNFDAGINTPQLVEKRLVYMTPEWKEAFRYAIALADELGLEAAIAGSPGWSETGGPWVEPAEGMKKYVWSETRVEGGKPFTGTIPKPPAISGPFQNIPRAGLADLLGGKTLPPGPEHYADAAVVAYGLSDGETAAESLEPKVTSSGGAIDAGVLCDGDFVSAASLPVAPLGAKAWVQFAYPEARTIRALTLAATVGSPFGAEPAPGPEFEVSEDGRTFRPVATVPGGGHFIGGGQILRTVAVPETTGRFFRVSFTTFPPPPIHPIWEALRITIPPPMEAYEIAQLVLHSEPRVHFFEEKAGFATLPDLYPHPTPGVPQAEAIKAEDVVVLTAKLRKDGSLDWTPPPGRWVVLRLGYSLTGVTNHPASPEATGLEADKLNRRCVKSHLDHYLGLFREATGGLMGDRGLQCLLTDSWEAGTQNWTDDMAAQFEKRRGYAIGPWLPVLAGRVVESAEASDKFLWDFRQTIAEMTADEHYDQVARSAKEHGLTYYTESHESSRAFVGDGMAAKRNADIPMGAIWTPVPSEEVLESLPVYDSDIRESASVAHIYGQNLVGAESLTAAHGPYAWSPATLKPTADRALALGLNRFVIHTSVHQPLVGKAPGVGLGPVGQWFTRNETWAEQAGPWVHYLARNSYMLQQGQFVADILYFYGEDSNITALFRESGPEIPAGYNFDYVNADALMNKFSVSDGRLVTESGMSYGVLALDPRARQMSLPVLRSIRDLVGAGAVVAGVKPVDTPSLADDADEFRRIADELWGAGEEERVYGEGRVLGGASVADAVEALRIKPDVEWHSADAEANLFFVHRRLEDGDLYFINNRTKRREDIEAVFRVEGKEAEFWHADTGDTAPASFTIADGRTTVPLSLEPWAAVFVVFRRPAKAASRSLPKRTEKPLMAVEGPWTVTFPPDRGAPEQISLEELTSWSEVEDKGVKYFSGTATYTNTFDVPREWIDGNDAIWLDLGEVRELAEVAVNGQPLGIVWKRPFRIDTTEALRSGANTLTVKATNLWINRFVGDAQPDAEKQYTVSAIKFYEADTPLTPSGLLGPVTLLGIGTE